MQNGLLVKAITNISGHLKRNLDLSLHFKKAFTYCEKRSRLS